MKRFTILIALFGAFIVPTASASAAGNHSCRQGDPPITASARTSCAFAGKIVTEWYNNGCTTRCQGVIWSPVTKRNYGLSCSRRGGQYTGTVTCTGPNGIYARFSADI